MLSDDGLVDVPFDHESVSVALPGTVIVQNPPMLIETGSLTVSEVRISVGDIQSAANVGPLDCVTVVPRFPGLVVQLLKVSGLSDTLNEPLLVAVGVTPVTPAKLHETV